MRLPQWLYEPLPILYGCTGLFLIANNYNLFASGSGILLLGASLQIWRERRRYRIDLSRVTQAIDRRCYRTEHDTP